MIESEDDWREKKTNKEREREREHVRDRNLKVRNRE